MRPVWLKEAWDTPENLRIRPILRIKNVRANHPAHEFAMPTSLEYTFLHGADGPNHAGRNRGSVLTRPIPPRRYNT
jgi:hypothetical protein